MRLTGPCRAIVATDPVDFEIVLKVNGKIRSGDRVLMCQTFRYSGDYRRSPTTLLNDFCKIVLHIEKVEKTVQATVVSVRVTERRRRTWPFIHGGRVVCVANGFCEPGEPQGRVTEAPSHRRSVKMSLSSLKKLCFKIKPWLTVQMVMLICQGKLFL